MFTRQAISIKSILDLPDPPVLAANATYKNREKPIVGNPHLVLD